MPRSALPFSLLVIFGAVGLAAVVSGLVLVLFGVPPAWGGGEPQPRSPRTNGPGAQLRLKLSRPISDEKGFGPSMCLRDALEYLADRYDLIIVVDSNAFAAIGVQKAEEQPVQLPAYRNVSLGTILRLLVSQIKGDSYVGAYHISNGRIEVTTSYHTYFSPMMWCECGRPYLPTVSVEARDQAIDEALLELADETGIDIVVDPKVRDRAGKARACSVRDVPLDTAVQLLADQADLGVATMPNKLYVTGRDRAREMQAESNKRVRALLEGSPVFN